MLYSFTRTAREIFRQVFVLLCSVSMVVANPAGEAVISGSASFLRTDDGSRLDINQVSETAIIHWNDFSIAAGELTQFNQPSVNARVLNRVVTGNPSELYGELRANGQVFLVNPNGVLIGPSGVVNAASFVASTLDMADQDFLNGHYHFSGSSEAKVINQGRVEGLSGDVLLIAREVENSGTLSATGRVGLAASSEVIIQETGGISILYDAGRIENTGSIEAAEVELRAAGGNAYALAINNTGLVRATGVSEVGGRIVLDGGSGVENHGSLIASGTSGGSIEATGANVISNGLVQADGTSGDGGTITMKADWISLGGLVSANGTAAGGFIALTSQGLSLAELVEANGQSGAGGRVRIDVAGRSVETGTSKISVNGATGGRIEYFAGTEVASSGTYEAKGSSGAGGEIDLSADSIRLLSAQFDASGLSGGGQIRVGGEYQGGKHLPIGVDEVPNASKLQISPGTLLRAEATGLAGEGGTVITWADDSNIFLGDVNINGGFESGMGGLLEISSHGNVQTKPLSEFDLGYEGRKGSLLLDPKNIIIEDSTVVTYAMMLDWNNDGSRNNPGNTDVIAHVDLDANRLVAGAPGDDGSTDAVTDAGAVYLFSFRDDSFGVPVLEGIIGSGYTGGKNLDLSAELEANDYFGRAVSLDGNELAVGATGDDGFANATTNPGAVYLFSFADDTFTTPTHEATIGFNYIGAKDENIGLGVDDNFGVSVSLDANRLAVGASTDNGSADATSEAGAVYLLTYDDDTYTNIVHQATIGSAYTGGNNIDFTLDVGDHLGSGVSLDGTSLAIGAEGDDGSSNSPLVNQAGAVHLFTFTDTSFSGGSHVGSIGVRYTDTSQSTEISLDVNDSFGSSVSLDGKRLAVGAGKDDGYNLNNDFSYGAVYLFSFTDTAFASPTLQAKIGNGYEEAREYNMDLAASDGFGQVALHGDRLAVGAIGADGRTDARTDSGSIYLFSFEGDDFDNLNLEGTIGDQYSTTSNIDLDLDSEDFLGDIALDGKRLAVGVSLDDGASNAESNAGAVYLFSFDDSEFSNPELVSIIGDGYTGGKNYNLDLDANDRFGRNPSLDARMLTVGAASDDGDGNANTNSGAVYLFTFGDDNFLNPTHQGTIGSGYSGAKDLDVTLDSGDWFGFSTSLDSNRLAVGAQLDDGNGNVTGNAGAVYLITFDDSTFTNPTLQGTLGKSYAGAKDLDVTDLEGDWFGTSVSLDGTNLAVGAEAGDGNNNNKRNTGEVYLFKFDDTTFTNPTLNGRIGFNYTGGGNNLHLKDLGFDDGFGKSVSLDGDKLVVTAVGDDGSDDSTVGAGAAYLITFSDDELSSPSLTGRIGKGYTGSKDYNLNLASGESLRYAAYDDKRLVLGAPGNGSGNGTGSYNGAVYLFTFDDSSFNNAQLQGIIGANYSDSRSLNVDLDTSDFFGVDVDIDDNRLVVGAVNDDGYGNTGTDYGAVYLFTFLDEQYNNPQLQGILGSGYTGGKNLSVTLDDRDYFGESVALDGTKLAVGARGDDGSVNTDTNAGAVHLFNFGDETFSSPSQRGFIGLGYGGTSSLEVSGLESNDSFGSSVSMDGLRLAVGAPNDDGANNISSNTGAAYLFTFDSTTFSVITQEGVIGQSYGGNKNLGIDLDTSDAFGTSVDISGTKFIGGAPFDDGENNVRFNSGTAFLVSFSDTSFTSPTLVGNIGDSYSETNDVTLSLDHGDQFGRSVAVFGSAAAVGALADDGFNNVGTDTGAVYTFNFSSGLTSGSLKGIIGKDYNQDNVMSTVQTAGSTQNFDVSLNNSEYFGRVAIDERNLVIGAPGNAGFDDTSTEVGGLYLFRFDDSALTGPDLVGGIGVGFKTSATINLENSDVIGMSIALDSNRLAIGGSLDDGYWSNNASSGAVQLYSFDDASYTNPTLQGTIGYGYTGGKNLSLPLGQGDLFGKGLDLDGTQLVVGAPGDDGLNDTGFNEGAVYGFTFSDTVFSDPTLVSKIGEGYIGTKDLDLSSTLDPNDNFGVSVSLDDTRLGVGAAGDDGSGNAGTDYGAAYLITFVDNTFTTPTHEGTIGNGYTGAKDVNVAVEEFDGFDQVSVGSNGAIVGAPGDDGSGNAGTNIGATYQFTFTDTSFSGGSHVGTVGSGYGGGSDLNLTTLENGDLFGSSLVYDQDGLRMAVGAPYDDGNGNVETDSGAVYVINFDDSSFSNPAARLAIGEDYTFGASFDQELSANQHFGSSVALSASQLGATDFNAEADQTDEEVYLYNVQLGNLNIVTYSNFESDTITFDPGEIELFLSNGNNLTLQANTDITFRSDVDVSLGGGGSNGTLTLQAGRSILFEANVDIATNNGDLNIYAGDTLANGVVDAERDAGTAVISWDAGSTLNMGTGALDIALRDGTGITNADGGDITLQAITSTGAITIDNDNVDAATPAGVTFSNTVTASSLTVTTEQDIEVSGTITTTGALTMTANAAVNGGNFIGIAVNSALSAGGLLTLTGTGGSTGSDNIGVNVNAATVSSATGGVAITGTGGAGANRNYGVYIAGNTAEVSSDTAAAGVSIIGTSTGTGADEFGVYLHNGGSVDSNGSAPISITATVGASGSALQFNGAGSGSTIGSAATTGDITLSGDTANWQDLTIDGSGQLTVQPLTNTTTLGLADGAAGTLNLETSELNTINDGFSRLQFGSSTMTGLINTAAYTFTDNVALVTDGAGSAGVTISSALSVGLNYLEIDSVGGSTQTGAITADQLLLLGTGGSHTLTNTGNDISYLAAVTDTISVYDSDGFTIGTANTTNGLTLTTAGTLQSTGSILDSQPSTVPTLTVTTYNNGAGANVRLDEANNDFDTITVNILDAAGTNPSASIVDIVDVDDLDIGGLQGTGTHSISANGALTDSGAITSSGSLQVTNNSAAGTTLDQMNASATLQFTDAGNLTFVNIPTALLSASTIAGNWDATSTTGSILDVGSVNVTGTSTLAATTGGIDLDAGGVLDGAITLNQGGVGYAFIQQPGEITIAGGNVNFLWLETYNNTDINQTGTITDVATNTYILAGTGTITLTDASNQFGNLYVSGGTVSITENDNITDFTSWTTTGTTTLVTSAGNDITLDLNANTFGSLDLTADDATINEGAAMDIAAANLTGNITLSTTGNAMDITDSGNVVVAGNASITAGGTSNVDMGTLQIDGTIAVDTNGGGNATLTNDDDINFAASTVGGNLTATATTNGITDSGAVTVAGAGTFTSSANNADITLDSTTVTGNLSLNTSGASGDATVSHLAATTMGSSTIGGALNLTTTGNDVSQAGGTTITVGGTATFTAGAANSVNLNEATNDFATVTSTSVLDLTLQDANSIDLSTLTISDDLTITAATNITDSGTITVTDVASLTATGGAITINDVATDFQGSTALVSGGATTVVDANALELGTSTVGGALSLSTTGNITQTAATTVTVTGTTTLNPGNNSVTLANGGNDFGTVTLSNTVSADFTEANTIDFGASTITNAFTVNAGTGISDSGNISVGGNTSLTTTANDITMDSAGNNFQGTLALSSGGNTTIVDSDDVDFAASSISGNLNVTAASDIRDSGAISVTGTTTLTATAGDITLNDAATDYTGTVTVTAGDDVVITDANAVSFAGATVSDEFTISASGAVTQTGGISANGLLMSGSGSFSLNNAANAITILAANTTADITFREDSGFDIGTVNGTSGLTTTSNLTLQSNGTVTQSQALNVTGTVELSGNGTFDFDGVGNNTVGTLQGTVGGTGAIDFQTDSTITIGTAFVGLSAGGNILIRATGAASSIVLAEDITADTGGGAGANDATIIIASDNIVNDTGNVTLNTGTGHFLIYGEQAADVTLGANITGALDHTETGVVYPAEGAAAADDDALYYQF